MSTVGAVFSAGRQGQHGGVVRLSVDQARYRLYGTELDGGAARQGPGPGPWRSGVGRGYLPLQRPRRRLIQLPRRSRRGSPTGVRLAQVNPETDDFDEAAAPTHDLVEALGPATGQVAGVKFRDARPRARSSGRSA